MYRFEISHPIGGAHSPLFKPMLITTLLLSGLAGSPLSEPPAALQENVLLIVLDDVGIDRVGAYNAFTSDVRTPVIDSLAARGVRFTRAWANPVCSPTRAAMLTGKPAFRTGVGTFIGSNQLPLQDNEPSIAKSLPAGITAAALGKWHLGDIAPCSQPVGSDDQDHAIRAGFRVYEGNLRNIRGGAACGESYTRWLETYATGGGATTVANTTYATTDTTDDAIDLIAALGDNPWFLWVAYSASHVPLHVPPASLITYDDDPVPPDFTDPTVQLLAMTEALDTEIGRLLANVDPTVLARTHVIVIGDNGSVSATADPPYNDGRSKGTVYEGGLRVPLIVTGPAVAAAGTAGMTCSALVHATDMHATVLEVFGAVPGPDPDQDTISFLPYLSNPGLASIRQSLYGEIFNSNFDPNSGPINPNFLNKWNTGISDGRWKLIQRLDSSSNTLFYEEFYDLTVSPEDAQDNLLTAPVQSSSNCAAPAYLSPQEQAAFTFLCQELETLRS